MAETYLAIMLQSLRKKEEVLTEIARLNNRQKEQLTSDESTADQFDETVEAKSKLLGQLEQLDSGFEKLYEQVARELEENREAHAQEIRQMQELIRRLTDKSVMIQAQEARNKHLMEQKLAVVKKHARNVRANSRAITGYYKSMDRTRYMDPQFLETKR